MSPDFIRHETTFIQVIILGYPGRYMAPVTTGVTVGRSSFP